MSSVLPSSYYYFFWLLEPALTIAGGISAIFDPEGFGGNLLPAHIERATVAIGRTSRGQIIISELGSCFILLAMISLSLFYVIKHYLEHQPAIQEKMIRGLLIPLAIADILHDKILNVIVSVASGAHSVAVTLLPLPISHLKSPSQWTHIVHSTVWITLSLFVVRVSWLLGNGRKISSTSRVSTTTTTTSTSKSTTSTPSTDQRPIPLPKSYSQVQVEQLVTESTFSESEEEARATPKRRGKSRKTPLAED